MEPFKKKCKSCERFFETTKLNKNYCTYACRKEKRKEHNKKIKIIFHKELDTSTKGALTELLIACDLIKKGWHVYRGVSYTCPFDLIIYNGKKLIRVEATTGHYINGKLNHCKVLDEKKDILAIYIYPDEIIYQPPLEGIDQ